jgi:excisionase family DNA binding protein
MTPGSPLLSISPELLTVEEAAVVARCSVKTVRRAYTSGVLTAYRRGGSRAVLLDPQDVRSWLQAAVVRPTLEHAGGGGSQSQRADSPRRVAARTVPTGGQLRFDLSADALRKRRNIEAGHHA